MSLVENRPGTVGRHRQPDHQLGQSMLQGVFFDQTGQSDLGADSQAESAQFSSWTRSTMI